MLQIEDLKQELQNQQPRIHDLREALGYDRLAAEKKKLDEEAAKPDFWNDVENTKKVLKEQKVLSEKIGSYDSLVRMYEDAQTMVELASEETFSSEEEQEAFLQEIRANIREIDQKIEEEKLSALLTGEFDANNAILTFHAGAGGTEAQDWVQMLYRMYARWSERHHFKVKVLDYLAGEEAGIKSASILITGTNAYGFLKSEHGVHRLVRISPFDASGRRQTSFASLEVMPEIDDDNNIETNPADLKIDTYRSGGAGGQHVNKTESAIRITHIPTGVIVACQNERSQHQNREVAMKMLKAKLAQIKEKEHLKRIEDIKGEQQQIGWGSQIRSYVFMPYTLVKDHRTGCETGNISAVMDGDIDQFINEYLKAASQGELQA
ncbi:peptide chain release factor 2 [uncultured Negativibacillus sp.]|uniref:peptide chain release factor 2 n=1 Tax=uncultured Negativibacillus sp. TaxID=1980696 RepID=UPI0025FB58FA|nr:peptide chain release factor 2 [uncultured Negativibacillus sp.]